KKVEDFWNLKLERFKQYCTTEFIELIPGVDNLLESLKSNDEFELSLVTGNSVKNAFQKLSSYKLDRYFTDGAFGNDNSNRNLLPPIALDRVNNRVGNAIYRSENTIIIGDTNSDILAAKTNDMKAMIIAKEEDHDTFREQKADSLMSDFSDLDRFYNEMDRIYN
ncbi:MAG: HAD hydrolase-like protein, partial [Candidatus Kapaibacterium sp.]